MYTKSVDIIDHIIKHKPDNHDNAQLQEHH